MKIFTNWRSTCVAALLLSIGTTMQAAWPTYTQTGDAIGSDPYYVLNEVNEVALGSNASQDYYLVGPGGTLTFNAKYAKGTISSAKKITVSQYNCEGNEISDGDRVILDNKYLITKESITPEENNYKEFTITLDPQCTAIRFSTDLHVWGNKQYVSNVVVTMASSIAMDSASLNLGTGYVGDESSTTSMAYYWSNIATTPYVNGTDASLFTIEYDTTPEKAKFGNGTITVKYAHTVAGTHSATLVFGTQTVALTGVTEKKVQTIDWAADVKDTLTIDDEVKNAATSTNGQKIIYSTSDENVIAISFDGTYFKAVGAGEATVTATQAGDDTWAAVSDSKTFTVTKKSQTIAWAADMANVLTIDDVVENAATASTGLKVTYSSSDTTVLAISEDSTYFTAVGAGEATITAKQAGNDTYAEAIAAMTFTVNKKLQTLAWAEGVADTLTVDDVLANIAVATSGLNVTYTTSDTNVIAIVDNMVKAMGTGKVVVTAHQEGNEIYSAADSIQKTFYVKKKQQIITWNDDLMNILTTDDITLTATAETEVQYISSDSTIAYVDADHKLVIVKYGTVTITAVAESTASFYAAETQKEVTIIAAQPEILAVPTLSVIDINMQVGESEIQNDGEASVEGTFSWDDSQYTVITFGEPGTYKVYLKFVPTNSDWYSTVERIEASLTVVSEISTAIESAESNEVHKAKKYIENGQLIIVLDGVQYDANGRRL